MTAHHQLQSEIIFALATSSQRSALHLHRVSGSRCIDRLLPFLQNSSGESLRVTKSKSPVTKYIRAFNSDNAIIDDGIVTFYFGPHSYTGEDTVELTLHGNPIIAQKLQKHFRQLGFRDALPGEFTQRSFLNGKIDLAQAEGVAQLIDASNDGALELAREVTFGKLSALATELRSQLIEVAAYLEAHVDFGAEEVGEFDPSSLRPKLEVIANKLDSLAESYRFGEKIKNGLKVALVGQPNAGKSSLYNALLQQERAIVTDIAGTTRDVLSENLLLSGREFVLLDTAGIRLSEDKVESLGIERSKKTLNAADLICAIVDLHLAKSELDSKNLLESQLATLFPKNIDDKKLIVVFNKTDIVPEALIDFAKKHLRQTFKNAICVCANHNDVSDLRKTLESFYDDLTGLAQKNHQPFLISQRQLDKVCLARGALTEVFDLMNSGTALAETMASLINATQLALIELVGEISSEDVFDKLFSDFCIGK